MTNSQAATHESLLVRCSPRAPGFSQSNLHNTFIYLCFRAITFYMLMIDVNSFVAAGITMKGIIEINQLVF